MYNSYTKLRKASMVTRRFRDIYPESYLPTNDIKLERQALTDTVVFMSPEQHNTLRHFYCLTVLPLSCTHALYNILLMEHANFFQFLHFKKCFS
jgi:hypothetical protein